MPARTSPTSSWPPSARSAPPRTSSSSWPRAIRPSPSSRSRFAIAAAQHVGCPAYVGPWRNTCALARRGLGHAAGGDDAAEREVAAGHALAKQAGRAGRRSARRRTRSRGRPKPQMTASTTKRAPKLGAELGDPLDVAGPRLVRPAGAHDRLARRPRPRGRGRRARTRPRAPASESCGPARCRGPAGPCPRGWRGSRRSRCPARGCRGSLRAADEVHAFGLAGDPRRSGAASFAAVSIASPPPEPRKTAGRRPARARPAARPAPARARSRTRRTSSSSPARASASRRRRRSPAARGRRSRTTGLAVPSR